MTGADVVATWESLTGHRLSDAQLSDFQSRPEFHFLSLLPKDEILAAARRALAENPRNELLQSEWRHVASPDKKKRRSIIRRAISMTTEATRLPIATPDELFQRREADEAITLEARRREEARLAQDQIPRRHRADISSPRANAFDRADAAAAEAGVPEVERREWIESHLTWEAEVENRARLRKLRELRRQNKLTAGQRAELDALEASDD